MKRSSALPFLIAVVASTAAHAETIKDPEGDFEFEVPSGFVAHDDLKNEPDTLFVFTKGAGAEAIRLNVQRLKGTIPHERLTQAQLPKDIGATLAEAHWQQFTIQVVRSQRSDGSSLLISRVVQVPLTPQAIQLVVVGPESHDAEMTQAIQSSL